MKVVESNDYTICISILKQFERKKKKNCLIPLVILKSKYYSIAILC